MSKQCGVCGTRNPAFSSNAKLGHDYCRGCQTIQPFIPSVGQFEAPTEEDVVDAPGPGPEPAAGRPLFPCNITLSEARTAICARGDFYSATKPYVAGRPTAYSRGRAVAHVVVFNYRMLGECTFPDPAEAPDEATWRTWSILRECRGLVFDEQSGAVVSRRFHKFFNVGERAETAPAMINLAEPHDLLSKLDGSMVAPIETPYDIQWWFKMGYNDDLSACVEAFVRGSAIDYGAFARKLLRGGWTPLFEWCCPKHVIKVVPAVETLTFLTARRCDTGCYMSVRAAREQAAAAGVPHVGALDHAGSSIMRARSGGQTATATLLEHVKALRGVEGGVLRFTDGRMYKLKTNWYSDVGPAFGGERKMWLTVLRDVSDDMIAALPANEAAQLSRFRDALWQGVRDRAHKLRAWCDRGPDAIQAAAGAGIIGRVEHAMVQRVVGGAGAEAAVVELLILACTKKNKKTPWGMVMDKTRKLVGGLRYSWDDLPAADGCGHGKPKKSGRRQTKGAGLKTEQSGRGGEETDRGGDRESGPVAGAVMRFDAGF